MLSFYLPLGTIKSTRRRAAAIRWTQSDCEKFNSLQSWGSWVSAVPETQINVCWQTDNMLLKSNRMHGLEKKKVSKDFRLNEPPHQFSLCKVFEKQLHCLFFSLQAARPRLGERTVMNTGDSFFSRSVVKKMRRSVQRRRCFIKPLNIESVQCSDVTYRLLTGYWKH